MISFEHKLRIDVVLFGSLDNRVVVIPTVHLVGGLQLIGHALPREVATVELVLNPPFF